MPDFFTIKSSVTVEKEIKKSRFIANVAPVSSPEESFDFFNKIRDSSATHNCWAYKTGHQYRFSDDGEPAGTAGKPIFTTIERLAYNNVIVVVTRFFGGIKLGTGGLIRAYGGVAAEALRAATAIPIEEKIEICFLFPFSKLGNVRGVMNKLGFVPKEEHEPDGIKYFFSAPKKELDNIRNTLIDITHGAGKFSLP